MEDPVQMTLSEVFRERSPFFKINQSNMLLVMRLVMKSLCLLLIDWM